MGIAKKMFIALVVLFSCVGIVFVAVFFAIRFHWTDEEGTVDERTAEFQQVYEQQQRNDASMSTPSTGIDLVEKSAIDEFSFTQLVEEQKKIEVTLAYTQEAKKRKSRSYCRIRALAFASQNLSQNVLRLYEATQKDLFIQQIAFSASTYLSADVQQQYAACESDVDALPLTTNEIERIAEQEHVAKETVYPWTRAEEWGTIMAAIQKDAPLIQSIAETAGIDARMLTMPLVVEQLRLFHTQRGLYKQFFQPLEILASATKTSWGVMSIKEQTAIEIEEHLKDPSSPYYLGEEYAHLLDFSTDDVTQERYERLTNEVDHSYAYLYGAVYLKQLLTQWERAGYAIDDRPEIIATLFNVGFGYSSPHDAPQVGGSNITIGDNEYTFGSLGYEYFYSTELMDEFPYLAERGE